MAELTVLYKPAVVGSGLASVNSYKPMAPALQIRDLTRCPLEEHRIGA